MNPENRKRCGDSFHSESMMKKMKLKDEEIEVHHNTKVASSLLHSRNINYLQTFNAGHSADVRTQSNCNMIEINAHVVHNPEQCIHENVYCYSPSLNAIQNPYYYDNNRLLYELFVERVQRSSPGQNPQ